MPYSIVFNECTTLYWKVIIVVIASMHAILDALMQVLSIFNILWKDSLKILVNDFLAKFSTAIV